MSRGRVIEGYREAFAQVVLRVQSTLPDRAGTGGPVRMVIAGGAALALLTGARVTEDVDATFSTRLLIGDDIEVSYRDVDGSARLLYLDRNYNDTLGLMHENAYADSTPIELAGVDRKRLDVRVLTPVDLAVSKIAPLSDQDREDIELLARRGLVDAAAVRRRGEEALAGYIGRIEAARTSIDIACRLIEAARPRKPRKPHWGAS